MEIIKKQEVDCGGSPKGCVVCNDL